MILFEKVFRKLGITLCFLSRYSYDIFVHCRMYRVHCITVSSLQRRNTRRNTYYSSIELWQCSKQYLGVISLRQETKLFKVLRSFFNGMDALHLYILQIIYLAKTKSFRFFHSYKYKYNFLLVRNLLDERAFSKHCLASKVLSQKQNNFKWPVFFSKFYLKQFLCVISRKFFLRER